MQNCNNLAEAGPPESGSPSGMSEIVGSDERFARIGHERLRNAQARDVAGPVPRKDAVRPLRLDELDLDNGRARLVDARDAAARHRLEREERHRGGTLAFPGG